MPPLVAPIAVTAETATVTPTSSAEAAALVRRAFDQLLRSQLAGRAEPPAGRETQEADQGWQQMLGEPEHREEAADGTDGHVDQRYGIAEQTDREHIDAEDQEQHGEGLAHGFAARLGKHRGPALCERGHRRHGGGRLGGLTDRPQGEQGSEEAGQDEGDPVRQQRS